MSEEEKKNKRKGAIATIVFHAVVLILFAILGMSYTYPPPENGMLINFGYDDAGSGEIEEMPTASEVSETQPEEAAATPQPSDPIESNQEAISQDMVESVKVEEKKKEPKPQPKEEVKEPQPTEEELRQAEQKRKMEELFAKTKSAESKSQGETTGGGNQGNPDGDKSAPQGINPGKGNSGISFSLGGRNWLKPPKIIDNSQDEGKVVVSITVDRYGKVMNAIPGARGSTTTSTHLYRLAKEAAFNTKFNADPNAGVQQNGTMTFVFEVK